MPRILALFAMLVFATAAVSAMPARADKPRVEIIDHGLYVTGPATRVPMPISVSGTMNMVSNVRLTKETRDVMGQLGTAFGFRYRVEGVPAGATVTIRTLHPKLTNPETGRSMDYGERDQTVNPGEERYTGFSFDTTYEIAEGDWAFQVIYKGEVIAEQKFKVVVPIN